MATREKRPQAPHLHAVKPADAPTRDDLGGKVPPGEAGTKAASADPEVVAAPLRRTFTPEFKQLILAQADACSELGQVGELLRKHGLYSSHLTEWRRQRNEGLRAKKRGRKANPQRSLIEENEQLKRANARLEHRLAQAEVIIDVQKKLSVLLGIPLKNPNSDGSDE